MRVVHASRLALAVAVMSAVAVAHAQSDDDEGATSADTAEDTRPTEEIEVVVTPDGRTPLEHARWREEIMREAIYAEVELRAREEEEMAWRKADPDLDQPESRIKWGYSPQAELDMRRENDFMHELATEQVKPASVIRIGF